MRACTNTNKYNSMSFHLNTFHCTYSNTNTNKYNFKFLSFYLKLSLLCMYHQSQICYFICQCYFLCETETSILRAKRVKKKAKLKELSNNISDRSEA